ncbi:hypothetical protein [Streptomyces alanosinicus]|uniref:hypothetical protein n=1 Tax=Streptomyces alanosinicus TaxID=68171 RepID=UPI00167270D1|nr:hypothetical protein [Streptomyces alanosinicus]
MAMLALFVMVADLLAERHAGLIDETVLSEAVEHCGWALTWFMQGVSTAAGSDWLVAASRVYLGVRWAADATTGFAFGAADALGPVTLD